MTTETIEKSPFGPFTELKQSKNEIFAYFYRGVNSMARYRKEHGFEPGKRVKCQIDDGNAVFGTISGGEKLWEMMDHDQVPVIQDDYTVRAWSMLNMTLAEPK